MKSGGPCRIILYHPGRQTERALNFSLDPNNSLNPDITQQILAQIKGHDPQRIYVNDTLVWEKTTAKTIYFDHDRVKSSI